MENLLKKLPKLEKERFDVELPIYRLVYASILVTLMHEGGPASTEFQH